MKLKAITLALFVAGLGASFALADDGHGKGKAKDDATTATTTGSTTTTAEQGKKAKITLCHKAGKKKYVKITVSKHAEKAHRRHGDVDPGADGTCPAPTPGATTTVPGTTTTTTQTTQ